MFHSNQHFDVTAEYENLAPVLDLAVRLCEGPEIYLRENDPVRMAWRVTEDGRHFCVGFGSMESDGPEDAAPGWHDFDGLSRRGFRCEAFSGGIIRNCPSEEWKDYMFCIACFSPWNCDFEK